MHNLKNLRFVKKTMTGDWGEISTIKIRREDFPLALNALQWECSDILDFQIPISDEAVSEIEIPGYFSALLDEKDISALVENYKLLGPHYTSLQSVFKSENDAKWLVPAVTYLISKANGEDAELASWVSHILKIKKENNHE